MALWIADRVLGLRKQDGQPLTPGCCALCKTKHRFYAAADRVGYCLCRATEKLLFDFPLPPGVCSMGAFGAHVCALSRDTDSLCAFSPENGALCLTTPAGSYPRDFAVSPCGRFLAVAGSIAGEVLVLDKDLHCIRKEKVAGAAVGVCFMQGGLAVLCAMGDDCLSARLVLISPRGVTEEIYTFPSQPLCLCPLPGSGCLLGCHGHVLQLNARGHLSARHAASLPVRIRAINGGILIADSLSGTIRDGRHHLHYRGKEPSDMCYV